jgi:hypothetical protein
MALTVAAAFDGFYETINLSGDHRETANARKDRVVRLLEKHFDIIESFATGSIPRFTALKGKSDVDVMVALHYSRHIHDKTPTAVLQSVRDALSEYRTGARKNGQAVTLYYDTWPNVDIVPVSRVVNANDEVTHYSVPNSNTDSWIKSRPKSHAANIERKASQCGANFRRITKMIKHWNLVHSDLLQSYHIEVLAWTVFDRNLDDTPWEVFQFLDNARRLLQNRIWYESGYVDEYLSTRDRQEILTRVDTAAERARYAWHATYGSNNNHNLAITTWKQIFGDAFPSYG